MWQLGEKSTQGQSTNESMSITSIVIEDFDEQAEMQAQIWN
jgi:hypothetical protein